MQREWKAARWAVAGLAGCLLLGCHQTCDAQNLEINLVDGNSIRVEAITESLSWSEVARDGTVTKRLVSIGNIEEMRLTDSPASKQAARVRQRLVDLGSDDYGVREAAEQMLVDPEFSSGFQSLIKPLLDDPRLEVRYRASRIFESLSADSKKITIKYDSLRLQDGTEIEGNAGDFRLQVSFRGHPLELKRSDLRYLRSARPPAEARPPSGPVQLQLFHQADRFQSDGLARIDFSTDDDGDELTRDQNVDRAFLRFGLKLGTELEGHVAVSFFTFDKYSEAADGNSIAVYDFTTANRKRFKGVTTIEFCEPSQPSIPAGVNAFGLYIAKVDQGRDFVMEAYDSDGDLLATVEAPSQDCGFMGVRSSEPMTRLRVLSNPYLFRIDRTVDEDYGLDNFSFTSPQRVRLPLSGGSDHRIRLVTGDLLVVPEVKWFVDQSLQYQHALLGSSELTLGEIAEWAPPRAITPTTGSWMAALDDGSLLKVAPQLPLVHAVTELEITPEKLVSLHRAGQIMRYPVTEDFRTGGPVLVFPTCRILPPKVEFTDSGYRWDAESPKVLQPVDKTSPLGVEGEDPTPTVNSVHLVESSLEAIPTLWLKPPPGRNPEHGVVRLTDGQRWVVGEGATFRSMRIGTDSLTVSFGDREIEIPMAEVASIAWPRR